MYIEYFALVDIDSTWIWRWLAEVQQATMPRRKSGVSPLKWKESIERMDLDASSGMDSEPESDGSQVEEQWFPHQRKICVAKGKLAAGKISPRGENILPAAI